MTRSGKRVMLVVGVLVIAAGMSSVWITVRHAEMEVQKRIAAVEIGMTEAEVRKVCGEPSDESSWKLLGAECTYMEYAYPYWWDHVIWLARGGKDRIKGARACIVVLTPTGEGGEHRVGGVQSQGAYYRNWHVVKRHE